MSDLLTTSRLIEILKQQDPTGDRVLVFRIEDEDGGDIIAVGDVYPGCISTGRKDAYQTQEGDKDCLRLNIALEVAD